MTTTTDSVGQTWNITNPNAQTIVLTPAVGGQSLPPNGLIPIPITVAVAAGNCTTACTLQTQITPLHGVAASTYNATMLNRATNGLAVYGFGVVGANTRSSYTWSIGAFSTAALGTPRYNQAMYRSGTNAAPSSGFYTATVTVQNNGAPGTMYYLEFVMPATVDPNVQTPSIVSATVNGANQTANYTIYNQNGNQRRAGRRRTSGPTRSRSSQRRRRRACRSASPRPSCSRCRSRCRHTLSKRSRRPQTIAT